MSGDWKLWLPHRLARVFPALDEADLAALVEDMKQRGFDTIHPIVMYEGMVLDGRNRLAACREAGVEPTAVEFEGDFEAARLFVARANLCRRHLTAGQRASIALELAEVQEATSPAGGRNSVRETAGNPVPSQKPDRITDAELARKVAELAGAGEYQRGAGRHPPPERSVSTRTVRQVIELKRKSPEAYDRVRRGEVSAKAASARMRRARLAPPPTAAAPPAAVEGLRQFADARRELSALRRRVLALADGPFGRALIVSRQQVEVEFGNLDRQLRYAAPFATCPSPDCGQRCGCGGGGWITEGVYNQLAPKLKERSKRI